MFTFKEQLNQAEKNIWDSLVNRSEFNVCWSAYMESKDERDFYRAVKQLRILCEGQSEIEDGLRTKLVKTLFDAIEHNHSQTSDVTNLNKELIRMIDLTLQYTFLIKQRSISISSYNSGTRSYAESTIGYFSPTFRGIVTNHHTKINPALIFLFGASLYLLDNPIENLSAPFRVLSYVSVMALYNYVTDVFNPKTITSVEQKEKHENITHQLDNISARRNILEGSISRYEALCLSTQPTH